MLMPNLYCLASIVCKHLLINVFLRQIIRNNVLSIASGLASYALRLAFRHSDLTPAQ